MGGGVLLKWGSNKWDIDVIVVAATIAVLRWTKTV